MTVVQRIVRTRWSHTHLRKRNKDAADRFMVTRLISTEDKVEVVRGVLLMLI